MCINNFVKSLMTYSGFCQFLTSFPKRKKKTFIHNNQNNVEDFPDSRFSKIVYQKNQLETTWCRYQIAMAI